MNLNHRAVLAASTRAFAMFVVLDLLMEHLVEMLLDISVKSLLTNASFGLFFTVTYFALIYAGWVLIMYVYAVIRPRFTSRRAAGLFTGAIYFGYTGLLLTQLLNLGVVPITLYVTFAAFNTIELPLAMLVGVLSYGDSEGRDALQIN